MNGKHILKGALHAHTTLSHDGVMSLEKLVGFLKSKGYDYLALTEHSYDVDAESVRTLIEQADAISSPDFIVIPGIEFRCHGWVDIIGYGVTELLDNEDPFAVIDHIHRHAGVAVFAHPNVRDYPIDINWVAKLDGCEVWNITNEGKYVPRPESIRKFRELATARENMLAFTGLDLHRRESFCNLVVDTFVDAKDAQNILTALRSGNFVSRSPLFSVDSSGNISNFAMAKTRLLRTLLDGVRTVRNMAGR